MITEVEKQDFKTRFMAAGFDWEIVREWVEENGDDILLLIDNLIKEGFSVDVIMDAYALGGKVLAQLLLMLKLEQRVFESSIRASGDDSVKFHAEASLVRFVLRLVLNKLLPNVDSDKLAALLEALVGLFND